MPRKTMLASSLSFLLLSASVTGLAIVTHGCSANNVEQQGLQRENSEILLTKYISRHTGALTAFKGIIQGNSPSEATAELEISNFYYNDGSTYSGPALASFTRYTDGHWVMKRFTINPGNMFGAVWFDTDESVPTNDQLNQIKQEEFWSEPLPWMGNMPRKAIGILLVPCGAMAMLVLVYIFQPKKKEG
jgi:hypothetical protein